MAEVPVTEFDSPPRRWPCPPACLPAAWLVEPPDGARVRVAGLVLVRQRPGTAKGVIFITLEDETGTINVIVWRKLYEAFRRAVIAGRCLAVTGRLQRQSGVTHVIAEQVEDISWMLDDLLHEAAPQAWAPAPRAAPAQGGRPDGRGGTGADSHSDGAAGGTSGLPAESPTGRPGRAEEPSDGVARPSLPGRVMSHGAGPLCRAIAGTGRIA